MIVILRRICRLASVLSLGTVLFAVGCQSARGGFAKHPPAAPPIPPLSTSPDNVQLAAGPQYPAASTQLMEARYPPTTPQNGFVPAAPQPRSMTASPGQQSIQPAMQQAGQLPPQLIQQSTPQAAGQRSSAIPQPLALTPNSAGLAGQFSDQSQKPQQVIQQVQGSHPLPPQQVAGCLPTEADWRRQMEEQTAALVQRLTQVEEELGSTKSELNSMTNALRASQQRIEELNQDVTHWQGEVQRLEAKMKAQQLDDLRSLDELTATLHQVLIRQPAAGAVSGKARHEAE